MPMHSPAHPGQLLREIMGESLTVTELAGHLGMPRVNLSKIINGRLDLSATTAIKLAQAFPNWDAAFWMRLQSNYDIAQAKKAMKARPIKPIKLPAMAQAS